MIFPAVPPRLLLAAGALVVLLAGGWYLHHSGYQSGSAAVQALWNADKVVAAKALADRVRDNEALRDADKATSEQVQHDLQARATASDARNADLARRLRDYEKRACRGTVPGIAAVAGTVPSSGESGRDREIGRLAAAIREAQSDAFAACARDGETLSAVAPWYDEVQENRGKLR